MRKNSQIKLLISVMVIFLLIISVRYYYKNKKLIESSNKEIKSEMQQIKILSLSNSELISKIISNKKLTYKQLETLMYNHKVIDSSFYNIYDDITAMKSKVYFEKHISKHIAIMSVKDILDLYYDFKGNFSICTRDDLHLDKDDLDTIKIILKTYKFYIESSEKITKKINSDDNSGVDDLERVYTLNILRLED